MTQGSEIGQAIRTFEEIRRLLGTLSDDARSALMSELNRSSAPATPSTQVPVAFAGNQNFSEAALGFLNKSKDGMTVSDLAPLVYPDRELARAKHNVRALLALLARNNKAHNAGDRWLVGPVKATAPSRVTVRKTKTGFVISKKRRGPKKSAGAVTAHDICLQIVSESASKMAAADVVLAAQQIKPSVTPREIYRALYSLTKELKVSQERIDGRALYSPVNGVKKKQA